MSMRATVVFFIIHIFLPVSLYFIFTIDDSSHAFVGESNIKRVLDNCAKLVKSGQISSDYWVDLRLNDMFYRRVYVKFGQITAVLGAYCGICLDVIYLGGTPQ